MGFDLAPAPTPTFYNPPLDVPFFLAARALPARIGAHRGAILALLPSWDRQGAHDNLAGLGLAFDEGACRKLPNNLDNTLELCPVLRRP